jgi:HEPN domain-containing protein
LADGAVGLHAQQAVDKALKVAIVLAEVELPRSHDLEQLGEQVEATGAQLPSEAIRAIGAGTACNRHDLQTSFF